MSNENKDYVTSSQIQKETNLSRSDIYFYKSIGLIKPIIAIDKVFLYPKNTIEQIKKIKELNQNEKMTLADIKIKLDKGDLENGK